MSPASRTIVALALLTLAGLVLSALLIHGAVERLRARAVETNIDFVLTELRESVESSVSLGLSLPEIQVAQDLIERARIGNDRILAVEIFETSGRSIYNTDRGSIGERVKDDWIEAIRLRDDDRRWRTDQLDTIVVGEEIRNDFGAPVGQVAITLAGSARDAAASSVDARALAFLAIALPAMLAVAVLVAGIFRAATRDLREVRRLLYDTGTPEAPSEPGSLAAAAAAMCGTIDETVLKVEATAGAVRALDEDIHEPA